MNRTYIPEPAASILILRKLCKMRYLEAAHLAHDFYLEENGHTTVRQALLDQIVETAIERGEIAQAQDIASLYDWDFLPETAWRIEQALGDFLEEEDVTMPLPIRQLRMVG